MFLRVSAFSVHLGYGIHLFWLYGLGSGPKRGLTFKPLELKENTFKVKVKKLNTTIV
jgi:hypothetical protein